jgi:hypothetical protein
LDASDDLGVSAEYISSFVGMTHYGLEINWSTAEFQSAAWCPLGKSHRRHLRLSNLWRGLHAEQKFIVLLRLREFLPEVAIFKTRPDREWQSIG